MLQSESQKNITQIQGSGAAMAKTINANSSANATKITIQATTEAYKELETQINITA